MRGWRISVCEEFVIGVTQPNRLGADIGAHFRRWLVVGTVVMAAVTLRAWGQTGPIIQQLKADFAALLTKDGAGSKQLPGMMLRVEAPASGLTWTDKSGTLEPAS